jgi:outer membrane lipoprotein-sorting protein
MFRCSNLIKQMSNRFSGAAVCFLVIATAANTIGQTAVAALTADALLRAVIEKYRTLKSYSVDGTFVHGTPPDSEDNKGSFQIRFARPSLRLESHSTLGPIPLHGIWWSDERGNYSWSSLSKRVDTFPADAVYAACWHAGGGPAYVFPELLDARFAIEGSRARGPHIASLPPTMLQPDQVVDDTDCYHLTLKNGAAMPDQSYDLWIAKNDLLIRKFHYRIGGGWHEGIYRNIQVNVELPEETFRIAAPGS